MRQLNIKPLVHQGIVLMTVHTANALRTELLCKAHLPLTQREQLVYVDMKTLEYADPFDVNDSNFLGSYLGNG